MDYVPVKTRVGNQLYMFAGLLTSLATRIHPQRDGQTRPTLALFETLRRTLIQRGAHHPPRRQMGVQ